MFGEKAGSMTEANVFGVAPSLENMRKHNSALGGKKVLFRGAFFWYHFRRYYFYMAPATVILGMILALTCWNTVEGHLVIGSLISMVSCIAVVASYVMIVPWRKHPSTIVYNRAFTNIFFSFNIIVETINHQIHPDSSCEGYAVITQFLLLAGELWLTCIALDLVFSLTNPFTSYRGNMRTYHFIVWGLTAFISFVFMVDAPCQDRFEGGLCWVRIISPTDSCIWGFYLFWILVMYLYQFGAIVFAYMRLKKGLPITFEIRSKCAAATFRLLFAYGCYLFIMMMFFFVVASLPPDVPGTPTGNFGLVFLYTIAIRGFVDAWVWFMQHDFDRSVSDKSNLQGSIATIAETAQPMGMHAPGGILATSEQDDEDEESGITNRVAASPSTAHRASLAEIAGNIAGAVKHAVENVAEASQETLDETDLSPQVNMALRKQIIKYVTMGVMKAASLQIASGLIVEDEGTTDNNVVLDAFNSVVRIGKRIADMFITKDPILENMQVTEFKLENEHPFKAFAPDVFQKLRMLEGIDDQFYLNALQVTEKEQLSEGASGAFMFFCGGGEFIVKTIKKGEADVLHRSLGQYLDYLEANPKSLLSRFLGSYSLGVYAQTFYFVVMRNVFQPGVDINERYDIKGSWVNRSAAPVKPTKKVVCRHCNEMFIPVNKEKCSQIVGYHEANVVLKDNDLRTKISLTSKEALPVLQVIKKDSDLLAKLGVLDYSLIVGVRTCKFDISLDGARTTEEATSEDNHILDNSIHRLKKKTYAKYQAKSVTGAAIYYMGIIDFLQDWTFRKWMERTLKIYLLGQDREGASVMHPTPYMKRFQHKMDEIFDLESHQGKNFTDANKMTGRATAPQGALRSRKIRSNSDDEVVVSAPKTNKVSFADDVASQPSVPPPLPPVPPPMPADFTTDPMLIDNSAANLEVHFHSTEASNRR